MKTRIISAAVGIVLLVAVLLCPYTAVLAVLAFVLAPFSVCGDLFASVIKRQSGIKDYGHIMPGHGGVMDRFDSVIAIAPVLHLLLFLLFAFGQIAA